jgi:antitoxin VapB
MKLAIENNIYLIYTILYNIYLFCREEMFMALSIRNAKAERLAREAASQSGENITQVIIQALEDRLERLRGQKASVNLTEEIMKIARRCSNLPDLDRRTPDEILGYDQEGIPA